MPQAFKKTVLPNGLRIITVPQVGNMAATVLVLVEAGSKYETKEVNGLSHFLEHMCFKGTTNRPNAGIISSELDGLGASYNAFTSHEYTGYYAKVEKHQLDKALNIISDLYLNPVFDAAEIEKEKGVIIEELNMYEDDPRRKIGDIFMHLLYGDQPAGWDVGGEKDIIKTLNRDHFVKYRGEHYQAGATSLIISGGFDEAEVLEKAQKLFAAMPTGTKGTKLAVKESQTKPEVILKNKKSDQTHIMIGVRTFDMNDERRYALEVLAEVLGGGMSSRLFQTVREKMGAAYYVRAGVDLFTDHGFLAASSGVEHSKLKSVIQAILNEFKLLRDVLVPAEELQRAKNHMSGNFILGLETSDELAVFYGTQEILKKKSQTPEELLAKVNAVTAEQVQAIAKEIFRPERLNMAMIGPQTEKAEFEALLAL